MNTEPQKSSEGLYIVKHETNFLYWLAWRQWSQDELGVTYFRPVMNAITPWPPETYERAAIVAERENAIRARVKFGKAAPSAPKPWKRWTPTEMNALEMAEITRRAREGYSAPSPSLGVAEPREGFHRASTEQHAQARRDKIEFDYWMEQGLGYDPQIGNRALDDTTPRQRTPEQLAAMLKNARARYPRAFGKHKAEFSDKREPLPYTPSDPEVLREMRDKLRKKLDDDDHSSPDLRPE